MKNINTPRKISYLHYAHKSCRGYEKHLKNSISGKWINFYPEFLFLQGLCFLYYNMHKELIAYILSFTLLLSMGTVYPYLSFILLGTFLLVSPFFFYKLYQMHIDKKIDICIEQDPYNYSELFLKHTKSPGIIFEFISFTVYWIFYGIFFLICLYIFSNMFLGNY